MFCQTLNKPPYHQSFWSIKSNTSSSTSYSGSWPTESWTVAFSFSLQVDFGWLATFFDSFTYIALKECLSSFAIPVLDASLKSNSDIDGPSIDNSFMSGLLRFSQFSGCWLILSVYILMSFDFPFVRLFGVR